MQQNPSNGICALQKRATAFSRTSLAACFEAGNGVTQDLRAAADWYTKAANQGNFVAQSRLGRLYLVGQGVERNYASAFDWLSKAASRGDADAQANLGYMWANGLGRPVDRVEALKWLILASGGFSLSRSQIIQMRADVEESASR